MISLKKYLDMDIEPPRAPDSGLSQLLHAGLESYASVLRSVGNCGARACPAVSSELQQKLSDLANRFAGELTPALLTETGTRASESLQTWANLTVAYFHAKTAEVKELLIVLAHTADSVGQRDHQYTDHFTQLTPRLRTISNLEDLTQLRASLVQQASELKTYVDQMARESQKLVQTLPTEVSTYQAKLKKVEELALRDALTGLANRLNLEERIDSWIARGRTFCVVMVDVNRLKQVNDQHGHLAGDSLLQQFAQELRSSLRSSDLVGRWGGDEFLIVMEGDATAARAQIERLRKWAFGQYTVRPGKGSTEVKLTLDAAIGLTEWRPGDTLKSVIHRADTEMYRHKGRDRH